MLVMILALYILTALVSYSPLAIGIYVLTVMYKRGAVFLIYMPTLSVSSGQTPANGYGMVWYDTRRAKRNARVEMCTMFC